MKRQTWALGLAVLGGIGWYAFRPELLFVRTHVDEAMPVAGSAAPCRSRPPARTRPPHPC